MDSLHRPGRRGPDSTVEGRGPQPLQRRHNCRYGMTSSRPRFIAPSRQGTPHLPPSRAAPTVRRIDEPRSLLKRRGARAANRRLALCSSCQSPIRGSRFAPRRRRHHAGHRATRAPAAALQRVARRGRDSDLVVDTRSASPRCGPWSSETATATCSPSPPTPTATTSAACTSSNERADHRAEADRLAATLVSDLSRRHLRRQRTRPLSRRRATTSPTLFVDAVPPGGLVAAVGEGAPPPPPPGCSPTATSSTSATGPSRCCTCPGHSPGSIGLWEAAHRRTVLRRRRLRRTAAR